MLNCTPIDRLADAERPRQTEGLLSAKRATSSSPPSVGLTRNCDGPTIGKVQNINAFKLQRNLN